MVRLGLRLGQELPLRDNIVCAKAAEESGFHSVWVQEGWGREAFTTLSAVSVSTREIRLATGIVNVYSRSPALVAMAASTLDEISGGRAILGLGVSTKAIVEDWHGLVYDRPLERAEEYVSIVRKILTGSTLSHEGTMFKLHRFKIAFKPVRPNIPIFLAALGPRMAWLAGRVADGILLFLQPRHNLPEIRKQMMKGAESAGRSGKGLTLAQVIPTCVSPDAEGARDAVKRVVAYYAGGADVYNNMLRRAGFNAEAKAIKTAWAEGKRDEATHLVSDRLLDSVCTAGTFDQVRKGLDGFIESAVELPIIFACHPGELSAEYVCGLIRELGANLR